MWRLLKAVLKAPIRVNPSAFKAVILSVIFSITSEEKRMTLAFECTAIMYIVIGIYKEYWVRVQVRHYLKCHEDCLIITVISKI